MLGKKLARPAGQVGSRGWSSAFGPLGNCWVHPCRPVCLLWLPCQWSVAPQLVEVLRTQRHR